MKIRHKSHGTMRKKSGFLLFPKRMPLDAEMTPPVYETRWLVGATWRQYYNAYFDLWMNKEWVDLHPMGGKS